MSDYTGPWRLIKDHFPGKSNRQLRDIIFNMEYDGHDCRILASTIGFSSPELAKIKLQEIHDSFATIRKGNDVH